MTGQSSDSEARRADLAERLGRVRRRIADATAAAGRADEPELIVVTKFFPADDVRHLAALGVRQVGENRDQEAGAKAADTDDLVLRRHFIGQLQTNKAKSVVKYADVVQSIDRPQLVAALGKAMRREHERRAEDGLPDRGTLEVLIQVDLRTAEQLERDAREPAPEGGNRAATLGRGGAAPADVHSLAALVEEDPNLELGGVMAVAPLGGEPAAAFARLMRISRELQQEHPHATTVSAGMSQDLEEAVAAGATHLRIGSDVLGPRPPLR
ncbi:YggS family pyridoxal phosphate enzyme [Zhihengliuella salsuginis]|uniref:Pyridoxal phosphate homeostasis protein n=1 Tax=Zhihengliuella salsuginis TaxID=578222 RepID=A0ABQ3GD96_9MICC|nr:alanine racemase [Zhihengliuella salsuginis]GHD00979.1 YggS family pyridoxal phosphate enzyme [Zhihengliuella salsuginis]